MIIFWIYLVIEEYKAGNINKMYNGNQNKQITKDNKMLIDTTHYNNPIKLSFYRALLNYLSIYLPD